MIPSRGQVDARSPGAQYLRLPSRPERAGGFILVAAMMAAGITLLAFALVLPFLFRAIDPAQIEAAGRGSPDLAGAAEEWELTGKPGTAAVFHRAMALLDRENQDRVPPPPGDPSLALWGGSDPFLERIFADWKPELDHSHPPVIAAFVSRTARRELGAFLTNSQNPGARAVLATLDVERAERFMPARAVAGQPLEATIYLTALLFQGNHLSPGLGNRIRQLADEAVRENRLGPLETIYLDLFALGVRLQWQPLVDLAGHLDSPAELRRAAHVLQVAGDDWPVYVSAGLWTRQPDALASFLIEKGKEGLNDLKTAMKHGRGSVRLLAERQQRIHAPGWRPDDVHWPARMANAGLHAPHASATAKYLIVFGGFFLAIGGLNLLFQERSQGRVLGRPKPLTILQAGLIASAFALTFYIFNEPFIAESGHKSEFRIQLPISIASPGEALIEQPFLNLPMDQLTLTALAIFFVLQLIVYVICWIKMLEIRRQPIASNLKLKLLENEDNLFDCGLYVGLGGTVAALIFLALGVVDAGLMAAYASTLFGIVFVALFKICHLRPYRRRLILESQAYSA